MLLTLMLLMFFGVELYFLFSLIHYSKLRGASVTIAIQD